MLANLIVRSQAFVLKLLPFFGADAPCVVLGWSLKPIDKYSYIGSPIEAIRENIISGAYLSQLPVH